jgi:RND family efflux transporter MFP subunit
MTCEASRMMRIPRAVSFCATVALVAATAAACSRANASVAEPRNDAPTVAAAKVVRGDIAQILTVSAEFRPYQEIDVHAKVAGYLKTIRVDVGDRVREGDLLATLEVPELADQLKQDDATIRRAGEEINRAQADLDRAQSAHEVAHLGATRLADVMKTQPRLIAQQDIDEATSRDRVAEAQIATAKAALAAAHQQLEIARADQGKTQTLIGYKRISAPFAGVITHRYADTGAMIQAGTSSQTQTMPVVRLSQNNVLRLIIPAPESTVPRIHLSAPVDINVQSLGRTFRGTVARFADRLDADTRTMRVEVDVPNPQLELVPGMYAEASIALDRVKDTLVAPVQAIDRSESTPKVMVVTGTSGNEKVEVRQVTLGLESADRVSITAGLKENDLVIIGNRTQLKPGMHVTPKLMSQTRAGE